MSQGVEVDCEWHGLPEGFKELKMKIEPPDILNLYRVLQVFNQATVSEEQQDTSSKKWTFSLPPEMLVPWKLVVVAEEPKNSLEKWSLTSLEIHDATGKDKENLMLRVRGSLDKLVSIRSTGIYFVRSNNPEIKWSWSLCGKDHIKFEFSQQGDCAQHTDYAELSFDVSRYWLLLELIGNAKGEPPALQAKVIKAAKTKLKETFWNDPVLDELTQEVLVPLCTQGINGQTSCATKGILFYGPPGTGKTMLSRFLAEQVGIRKLFFGCSVELNRSHVGETEEQLNKLFLQGALLPFVPSAIAFEEVEAIASARRPSSASHEIGWLGLLLQRLTDPLYRNVFIIASTNRRSAIDPAFIREGRVQTLIYVGRIDDESRLNLMCFALKEQQFHLLHEELKTPDSPYRAQFAKATFNCSGAMIVGAVKRLRRWYDTQVLFERSGRLPSSIEEHARRLHEALNAIIAHSDDPDLLPLPLGTRVPSLPAGLVQAFQKSPQKYTGVCVINVEEQRAIIASHDNSVVSYNLSDEFDVQQRRISYLALAFSKEFGAKTVTVLDARRTEILHHHEEGSGFTALVEESRQAGGMGGCVVVADCDDIGACCKEEQRHPTGYATLSERLLRDAAFQRLMTAAQHVPHLTSIEKDNFVVLVMVCATRYVVSRVEYALHLRLQRTTVKAPPTLPLDARLHHVRWSHVNKHGKLELEDDAFAVRLKEVHKDSHLPILGDKSFNSGIHYFSVSVSRHGEEKQGNHDLFVGWSNSDISFSKDEHIGKSISKTKGCALYLLNDAIKVWFTGCDQEKAPSLSQSPSSPCEIGCLLDLNGAFGVAHFFLNGQYLISGPYKFPKGEAWYPYLTLRNPVVIYSLPPCRSPNQIQPLQLQENKNYLQVKWNEQDTVLASGDNFSISLNLSQVNRTETGRSQLRATQGQKMFASKTGACTSFAVDININDTSMFMIGWSTPDMTAKDIFEKLNGAVLLIDSTDSSISWYHYHTDGYPIHSSFFNEKDCASVVRIAVAIDLCGDYPMVSAFYRFDHQEDFSVLGTFLGKVDQNLTYRPTLCLSQESQLAVSPPSISASFPPILGLPPELRANQIRWGYRKRSSLNPPERVGHNDCITVCKTEDVSFKLPDRITEELRINPSLTVKLDVKMSKDHAHLSTTPSLKFRMQDVILKDDERVALPFSASYNVPVSSTTKELKWSFELYDNQPRYYLHFEISVVEISNSSEERVPIDPRNPSKLCHSHTGFHGFVGNDMVKKGTIAYFSLWCSQADLASCQPVWWDDTKTRDQIIVGVCKESDDTDCCFAKYFGSGLRLVGRGCHSFLIWQPSTALVESTEIPREKSTELKLTTILPCRVGILLDLRDPNRGVMTLFYNDTFLCHAPVKFNEPPYFPCVSFGSGEGYVVDASNEVAPQQVPHNPQVMKMPFNRWSSNFRNLDCDIDRCRLSFKPASVPEHHHRCCMAEPGIDSEVACFCFSVTKPRSQKEFCVHFGFVTDPEQIEWQSIRSVITNDPHFSYIHCYAHNSARNMYVRWSGEDTAQFPRPMEDEVKAPAGYPIGLFENKDTIELGILVDLTGEHARFLFFVVSDSADWVPLTETLPRPDHKHSLFTKTPEGKNRKFYPFVGCYTQQEVQVALPKLRISGTEGRK